jgi:hypothetical protein
MSTQLKTLVKLEELAQILLSIYLFSLLPFAWWVYPLFFFAPDLSMIGMLLNKRIGALTYNLIHHKALALGTYILGALLGIPLLSLIGVLLFGHSSFDRVLGFGLLDTGSQSQSSLGSIRHKA